MPQESLIILRTKHLLPLKTGDFMGDNRENEGKLVVSYDRNSVTIRLYATGIFDYYKDCRKEKSGFYNCDCLEMPSGTVTPDGYVYQVRGRVSLKDYICGESNVTIPIFISLLRTLAIIAERADRYRAQMEDCIFDYNCVFLKNGLTGFSLIYMPGAALCSGTSTAGDLVNLVFLNVDMGDVKAEDVKVVSEKIEALKFVSGPVALAENLTEIAEIMEKLYSQSQGFSARFKRKIGKKKENNENGDLADNSQDTIQMATLIISSAEDEDNVVFQKTYPMQEGAVVKIGRDDSWADLNIKSIFVSRKHAELYITDDGNLSAKDFSLNGTYVNGVKADAEMQFRISENQAKVSILGGFDFFVRLKAV